MASINGISIKNLKKFRGHEGEPLAQGTVYYKGKKLGYWSQDFHGGPDAYEFDARQLNDEVAKYRESGRVEEMYKEYTDLGCILEDLVNLMETEKTYKKGVKVGYPTYVEANDGYHVWGIYYKPSGNDPLNEPKVQGFLAECRARALKDKTVEIAAYNDPKDFDIVYEEV